MHECLNFTNLSKHYQTGLRGKKIAALQELSLSIPAGEVFGIIGPNGAGKSTTLKILMGFVRPSAGHVRILGRPATDPSSHRHLGFLPENPSLYEGLSIIDHLRFAARLQGISGKETENRVEWILSLVKLEQFGTLPIRRFSKGMVQRAALAYALFHQPKILILDEPMSGLDPLGRQLVIDVIRDYNREGNTILFCSHILTDVERICDRIGIMNRGRLLAIITPEEIKLKTADTNLQGNSPLEFLFLQNIKHDNDEEHLGRHTAEL